MPSTTQQNGDRVYDRKNTWTPDGHGSLQKTKAIAPVVLSNQDISAIPLENFSNNTTRCTGGCKQIFSNPLTPTNELNIGIAHFPPRRPDQESFEALHRHPRAEFYYMLKGQCVVKIEGVEHKCEPGHALFIPSNAEHGFWNTSETEELVFLWGFAVDGYQEVVYTFSEGAKLISDR